MIRLLVAAALVVRLVLPASAFASDRVIWDVVNWQNPVKEVLTQAGYTLQRVVQRGSGKEWVLTVAGPDIRKQWSQDLTVSLMQAGSVPTISVVQMCRAEAIATVVNTTSGTKKKKTVRFEIRNAAARPMPADIGPRTCWLNDTQVLHTAMVAAKRDQHLAPKVQHVSDRGGRVFVLIEDAPDAITPAGGAQSTFFTVQLGAELQGHSDRLATLVVQPVTGDVLAEGDSGVRRDLANLRPLDVLP